MKTQIITLRITYDEGLANDPSDWLWGDLIGIGPDTPHVEVLESFHPVDTDETYGY